MEAAVPDPARPPLPGLLLREEYVEQAYFFRTLSQRMQDNLPVQDLLETARHELLATTKLPMAIDFLMSELKHAGGFATAMARLPHYFTRFQTFLVEQAEDERGRFDFRVALAILRREAEYRSDAPSPQGAFLYQFESLCRNRLSYDLGLAAMALDPIYSPAWRQWILTVRRQVGLVDMADLIYVRSQHAARHPQDRPAVERPSPVELLFGEQEGRIALANRRKDPLLLFAALQRQLGYPQVPRPQPHDRAGALLPQLARRLERMEARVKLLEDEQKGGIDLTKFYGMPSTDAPPDSAYGADDSQ